MISNEERREIAAKLRELATHGRPTWPALMDLLKCPGREVAVMYLADLIEPEERTCRMCDASWDDGRCTWGCICLECGAKHEHKRSRWMNFCPNCVARVVKEDAE